MAAQTQDIAAIFQSFVGRAVEVRESVSRVSVAGEVFEIPAAQIEPAQDVLKELQETALRHQFNVRVTPPGAIVTMDFNPSRLNVHVHKAEDGVWRIADDMHFDGQKRLLDGADKAFMRGTDKKIGVLRPLKFKLPGT